MILPERRSSMGPRKSRVRLVSAVMLSWICPRLSSTRNVGEFSKLAVAGVVDQNVHRDAFTLQLRKQCLRGGRLSQIERERLDRDSELALQFIGDLRQPGSVARHQHQVVMVFGEKLGQFVSDAAGSAGDQCGRESRSFTDIRHKACHPEWPSGHEGPMHLL